jgi:hypothetical protein
MEDGLRLEKHSERGIKDKSKGKGGEKFRQIA